MPLIVTCSRRVGYAAPQTGLRALLFSNVLIMMAAGVSIWTSLSAYKYPSCASSLLPSILYDMVACTLRNLQRNAKDRLTGSWFRSFPPTRWKLSSLLYLMELCMIHVKLTKKPVYLQCMICYPNGCSHSPLFKLLWVA